MGIIRGSSVIILCVLLFLSFMLMDSFFILGSSLKYDNVKSGLSTLIQNVSSSNSIISKEITGNFNMTKAALDVSSQIAFYCQNRTQYNFTYKGYNITLPCTAGIVNNPSEIVNKTLNDLTYQIYYTDYNCSFFDCFSKTQQPFFLISEKSMNFWMNKFYTMLIISIILLFLIFLFVEQKQNTLIIAGSLFIIAAFPILKLKDFISILAGKFSPIINLFLGNTGTFFTTSLIIGISLIVLGIILRILLRNKIKKKLSVDDVKTIVKEEMSKSSNTVSNAKTEQKVKSTAKKKKK